jgi:hypothetical protein
MNVLQVYWVLFTKREQHFVTENNLRRQAFYTVAPHWSGNMPLKYLWQLWEIPEIDGSWEDRNIYSKIREATDEEKEKFEKIVNGR